jgi:putative GTP pyrophosphokinase
MKVEVQLRTIAMDFWASLEHRLAYKKTINNERAHNISNELKNCAETSAWLDLKMKDIRDNIESMEKGNNFISP